MATVFLGSIDSLFMAAAMVLSGCPQAFRRQVIVGFIAFDFVAALAGWSFGVSRLAAVLWALVLACPMLYLARKRPALYVLIPVLCSIDNLFMGGDNAPFLFWPAAGDAVASGVFAWAGFVVGGFMSARMKGAAE